MANKKTRYHLFTVKVMRAPPGAPTFQLKIIDTGQSRPAAFFQLAQKFNEMAGQLELPFTYGEKRDQK